jgi:MFS superfamily sulfate permease-like transporter
MFPDCLPHVPCRGDFYIWSITAFGTAFLGVQDGLILGMGSSVLYLVKQTHRPFWAVLGRIPG